MELTDGGFQWKERLYRAKTLARLAGRTARAHDETTRLADEGPIPGYSGFFYDLANAYALCVANVARDETLSAEQHLSRKEQYGRRAVELLQREERAFFLQQENRDLPQGDEDFDGIAPRADFQAFVAELKKSR